ncbi:hypothetical protein [Acetobacter pasteurianus]|uniref:Uncharacterized protein n=1 Tax=Acetobacter pasteurianus NBRC 3188 TaxID=1226663 RepID=A0A401WUG9_ACEPA|nr:hypothetical protein [Acetobacter pasteurianus]GCD52999.1 hypothetical protein NBRC3188_1696 [Acetobacter pasteurianus NBRC 3188]
MTDSHETNHAAEAGSRHADGVRGEGLSNEQALRKWALQTILLSPHPMPKSWDSMEVGAARLVAYVKTGSSVLPDVSSIVNTSFFDRGVQAGNENVGTFKGFQNLGLRTLQFGNAAFQFFRSRLHKNSSSHGLGKHMMDEAGRGDNAAARTTDCPQNANAGVAA